MAQPRRMIEDFDLERNERETNYPQEYTFLIPFVGPIKNTVGDWQCLKIEDPNAGTDVLFAGEAIRVRNPWGLHQYAVHNATRAYVVFTADLCEDVAPFRRFTDMRLWEMVVENWVTAGNAPDSLRYVGFSIIINHEVLENIQEEWSHQLAQGRNPFGTKMQRMLTVTPANSITWNRNFFIRTGTHVAESLSTAARPLTLEKAHIVRRAHGEDFIVLEFKNVDKGQENYRESLVRELLPMTTHNMQQKQLRQSEGQEWENIVFIPPGMRPGSVSRSGEHQQ